MKMSDCPPPSPASASTVFCKYFIRASIQKNTEIYKNVSAAETERLLQK